MQKTFNPQFITVLCFILFVALFRIATASIGGPLQHFSPLGAMALFGGAYFSNKPKVYFFTLGTLLISDFVMNKVVYGGKYGFFYDRWYMTYIIFAAIVFLGNIYLKNISTSKIVIATILTPVFHWLVSDFFVWYFGGINILTQQPLSKNWAGLSQCFAQGFPFMQNFMIGTIVFSTIMFGGYEYFKKADFKLKFA
ncbi:MAG: hypothetical protein KA313_03430 [Pseudarcicella sp.]|nr:hypothetical protein [Pseudarcicella sp.]